MQDNSYSLKRIFPAFTISLLIVILDQVTKYLISSSFMPGEVSPILPFLNITHWRNTGGLFGLFQNLPDGFRLVLLTVLPIGIIIILPIIIVKSTRRNTIEVWGWVLIFGGAIGNMADRLFRGSVVDFIDFHIGDSFSWPAFNVADSAISIGLIILIVESIFCRERKEYAPNSL